MTPADARTPTHPVAVLLCTLGLFLHIFLSGPVLNILGIDYGGDDAGLFSKVHPGSWVIILSFVVLLCSGNPFDQMIRIARQQSAFFALASLYVLIIFYWALRGPKGIGLIPDVHITAPMAAIVFCYAPAHWYRRIVYGFAAFALLNSSVGIFESLTHLRVFAFDSEWEVLQQDYFRASAFMGHPLINAAFTVIGMFVMLDLRLPLWLKSIFFLIMLASLIAFGGRSALIAGVAGSALLGLISIRTFFIGTRLTILRLTGALAAALLVPLLCVGLLYGALHSHMGARLMAYSSLQDDSAGVRLVALRIFENMSAEDFLFGMDGEQVDSAAAKAGIAMPSSDIENPWLLMLMFLGAPLFTLWLGALAACVRNLMSGASPALKIAIIDYFLIASAANSFGRKDPLYTILMAIIICAKQLRAFENKKQTTL